jgi:hypothetical protein
MRWLVAVALLLWTSRADAQVFKPRGKTPVVKAVPGVLPAAVAAPLVDAAATTATKATAPQPPAAAAAATPKKATPAATPAVTPRSRVTTGTGRPNPPKRKKADDDDVKIDDDDE